MKMAHDYAFWGSQCDRHSSAVQNLFPAVKHVKKFIYHWYSIVQFEMSCYLGRFKLGFLQYNNQSFFLILQMHIGQNPRRFCDVICLFSLWHLSLLVAHIEVINWLTRINKLNCQLTTLNRLLLRQKCDFSIFTRASRRRFKLRVIYWHLITT